MTEVARVSCSSGIGREWQEQKNGEDHDDTEPTAAARRYLPQDQAIQPPHTSRARPEEHEHRGDEQHMKALLTKAHPLRCQTVVQREQDPDQGRQPYAKAQEQCYPYGHLAVCLEVREELRVRQYRTFQELLVPVNRIAVGKFRHALRLESEEARRHGEIRHGTPRKLYRELRPHRFEEPCAHNEPQHSEPDLRYLHASPPSAACGCRTIRMGAC